MSDLQCPARLVFVRHGEAGHDLPRTLTLAGRGQAGGIADALRGDRVAAIWSSTMPRAAQTAAIIARELRLIVRADDRLREFSMAEEDMPAYAVGLDELNSAFLRWLDGDLTPTVYGESGAQIVDRFTDVAQDAVDAHRGEVIVLVAHGGILQAGLRHRCSNLDAAFVRDHPLPLAGTVVVDADADGWVCRRWHDVELG